MKHDLMLGELEHERKEEEGGGRKRGKQDPVNSSLPGGDLSLCIPAANGLWLEIYP